MDNIPTSKKQVYDCVLAALKAQFNDEVVEVIASPPNYMRIRVGQGDRGPRYFRVNIVAEV